MIISNICTIIALKCLSWEANSKAMMCISLLPGRTACLSPQCVSSWGGFHIPHVPKHSYEEALRQYRVKD